MHSRELVSMLRAADEALHQLVGDVVILGQALAGDVERHAVRAVLRDGLAETRAATRSERLVPAASRPPIERLGQPPVVVQRRASAAPLEHSRPRLDGCAASPAIVPSGCATTPQPTPQ